VNNELVGTVGNFVYRSLLFAAREFGGSPDVDLSDDVRERIETAIEEFEAGVNDYSVREVGESAVRLAQFGNEYIQRNEPWKLDDDDPEKAQVIRDCVQIAKAVAVLFEPVTPEAAENLWADLGEAGDVHTVGVDAALDAPAGEFEEPTELFEKIPEERVEELNEKLESRVAAASEPDEGDAGDDEDADAGDAADEAGEEPAADLEPIADERIGFEDFQALDIRVGEILAAEGVEGADKLARLTVDIGVEERQIVAGIKQLHDLDALVGEKIVVVANLEKAELFGVESNGMLLAAGEQADLLTTHGDAEPGTKIR
jgi:methionyl-tRNA synthetase